MNDTLHISSAPPERASTNYSVLRESGMEWIRRWAKDSWTDHNVHDPGITLLEAMSYAMTEPGLRLGLDMGDLLRSGEAHGPAELEPAHRVLPMGPVSSRDLRRVLLDHPIVSDVQILEHADNEIPFFEVTTPGANPPLTFTPGTTRIRPSGLYEVLVELADRDLNTNTYVTQITSGTSTVDAELALPFWDDPEAAPFRQAVTLTSVVMINNGGFWRPLPEAQSFFGRATVSFTGTGGPGTIVTWVLLRIITPLPDGAVPAQLLDDARLVVQSTAAAGVFQSFAARVREASEAVDTLRTFLSGWRNLGEQAVRIGLARVQDIAVKLDLEVTGGIDLELLVAQIFMDIDTAITPRTRFEALADRRAVHDDPERIYDGPLLRRGFLTSESLDRSPPTVLYTSDMLRIVMRRRDGAGTDLITQENPAGRDIVAVANLSLSNFINNRVITADAEDCLHLVEITRYRPRLSLAKSRITTFRNLTDVAYDTSRMLTLFGVMRAKEDADAFTGDPSPVWPVERGESLPIEDYTPIQNELPAIYGVGQAVLPDSAGVARHAAARQLQGYLFPLEQVLGDLVSQLGHVNRFFSGRADEAESCFVHAPFDLPGARSLLRRFNPAANWELFAADPDNPVMQALRMAAESRSDFLDRRNRMLDHLLARQGEDAVALSQEIHRWARAELAVASLPPPQQQPALDARRDAANARLVRSKAALLQDMPLLHGFRLLANANPFLTDATLLRMEPVGTNFRWLLAPAGTSLLRAVTPLASLAEAGIAAERAFYQAGRPSNYQAVNVGAGQHRLRLFDGSGASAVPLAESEQSFASVGDANAALPALAAIFAARRLESSLSPLELRIAHHAGIRGPIRRRSLNAVNLHFEIFNEPAPPGMVGRRWRLRGSPAVTGPVLLVSAVRFDAPTAPQAEALAEASIREALRFGMDEWNYHIPELAPFTVELRNTAGTPVATTVAVPPTAAAAEAARAAAIDHLYATYGCETFYLVEHLLLRPRVNVDGFLSLRESETARERDPYSQRLSLVFPSGFARDFSQPATAVSTESAPDRFRDPEFRRHVAGMVQRACPAHLMPTIYWVDRQAPGTPDSTASFDAFESRYFAWLDTVLIPGATPAAIDTARNELVQTLNGIADAAA